MEIQNLSGSRVVHAPESSSDAKSQITHLTKSTLLNLKDIPNQKLQKDQGWILQIIHHKEFELKEEDEKKKLKIKAKYTLSDGVSFVKAMVPDTAFNKLVSIFENSFHISSCIYFLIKLYSAANCSFILTVFCHI